MAKELGPEDKIPDSVITTFLGAEGESPETVLPEDTWSPGNHFIPDGRHLYEIPVITMGRTRIVHSDVIWHRPIMTKRYVEQQNAAAASEGRRPPFRTYDEMPKIEWRKTLFGKVLGKLGLAAKHKRDGPKT